MVNLMATQQIERARFGRTGHLSSRVIFGAAGIGTMKKQERADELLPILLQYGINHIDTASSYGDSELRLAPWLRQYRKEFFLATKTGERTGAAARASLERSLERMGVDSVDLIQLHNLVEPDEWERAHGKGGAVEALAAARDEGLVRFIGVTGHGTRIPSMHLRSLERFDFDSVLFPYNFTMMQSDAYRADVEALLAVCEERNVAVQTIKSAACRRWTPDNTDPHFSWYEALPAGEALAHGVDYVLGRPNLFLNTSSDSRLLRPILEAAVQHGGVPSDEVMRADVETHQMSALFDGGALERI
jgi:aryl-alcohol dehydrogenase-like predicted oxidoreductase